MPRGEQLKVKGQSVEKSRSLNAATQTRFGLMRLTSLHMVSEIRRTDDSRQSESLAKPARPEAMSGQERMGWLETEYPEVQVCEPRRPVLCQNERNRSQSPRSSEEAGNDRGAKGDRKVKA